jgi:hypothetical protein
MNLSRLGLPLLLGLAACSTTTTYDYNEPLAKAVSAKNKAFRSCYRKEGQEKDVKLTMKFRTNFGGEIQFAEADPTQSENATPELGTCVAKIFQTIQMPEAQGKDGIRGTYTFLFSSK